MNAGINDKIGEVYALCLAGNDDNVKFLGVAKNFWAVLDNTLTLCELSGIYAIANPRGQDHLDMPLFKSFCNTVSKIKYPAEVNHLERLMDDLISARALKCGFDSPTFTKSMEKSVMRVLLKFDMPLRRSFSAFAGRGVKIGGGLTWEEVKRMEVGMDLEGFTAFCGAYALIPNSLSLQQCTTLGRDILKKYPLLKSKNTLGSTLLYPQFQLLLCFAAVAVEQAAGSSPTASKNTSPSHNMSRQRQTINRAFSFNRAGSKRMLKEESKPIYTSLSDLLKNVGIDVPDSMAAIARTVYEETCNTTAAGSTVRFEDTYSTVIIPSTDKPEDMYSKASNHTRESTFLRMENLFDEVTLKIRNLRYSDNLSEEEKMDLPGDLEEYSTASLRNTGKPTVIGDSIPPPMAIPPSVQHSLEAALAYHNLGSYEESLKYLETARAQLTESEKEKRINKKKLEWRKVRGPTEKNLLAAEEKDATTLQQKLEVTDAEITIPAEAKLYIIACKGNVYQSCGDDEQSILQYMLGWNEAQSLGEKDWEAIFINSIGLLSFYNLRYELAWKCFSLVTSFRSREYGIRSADTATSWNNTACCLLCMSRTSEARVLFEQARTVFVDALGDRHPRTLVSNKNCVKAKRSQTIVHTQNMKANISMRPDADRLLLGKDITINATPPEVKVSAASSGSKTKSKKKKK